MLVTAFSSRLYKGKHLSKIFASNLSTLNLKNKENEKGKLWKNSAVMKYILVTGGVISGVGKGKCFEKVFFLSECYTRKRVVPSINNAHFNFTETNV